MDEQTLRVYDQKAASIAARHRGNTPNTVHDLALRHFRVGEPTADIGCGSGRDTEWLHHQGFPTVGFDASKGMLAEARKACPTGDFRVAYLPALSEIPDASFVNVLCNAVLMHLPKSETPIAIRNLARILVPAGHLLISFRGSADSDEREKDGRLYTRLDLEEMTSWIEVAGLHIQYAETRPDPVRGGREWSVVLAQRPG